MFPRKDKFFKPEHQQYVNENEINAVTIGIDQSINSTGISIISLQSEKNDVHLQSNHFLIPMKDLKVREFVNVFKYEKVIHEDRTLTNLESAKLLNSRAIADEVVEVSKIADSMHLKSVGIEGLSYNSKSSNLLDLSGLNVLIRDRVTTYLNEIFPNQINVVNMVSPMTNKASFVKGGCDKMEMWGRFCEEFDIEYGKEIDEKKESYLFDIVDSYSIARKGMLDFIESHFPKKEVVYKEPPTLKIKKRLKYIGFNLRLVEKLDENGKRYILCSNGRTLPLDIKKSTSLKLIVSETHQMMDSLSKEYGVGLVKLLNGKAKADLSEDFSKFSKKI